MIKKLHGLWPILDDDDKEIVAAALWVLDQKENVTENHAHARAMLGMRLRKRLTELARQTEEKYGNSRKNQGK